MMEVHDLVSIIIPVFNSEKYLARAIQCALDQTYKPSEIIIVDDGSTDKSAEIAQSFSQIKYYYQSNMGCAAARNLGLTKAQGEFIAFIDADDSAPANKLEIQIKYLLDDDSLGLNIGHLENRIVLNCQLPQSSVDYFLNREKIGLMSMVVRKNVFEQVGNFNVEYIIASDFEWITRARDLNISVKIIPDIVHFRYLHADNLTFLHEKPTSYWRMRIIKESLERKRRKSIKK